MANNNFFKIHGATELGKELQELSRAMQNKIIRPALRQAVAEVRKVAKRKAPVGATGKLKKNIKSKVTTSKGKAVRGKGVVGRIGIFTDETVANGTKTVAVAKYGAVQNFGSIKRNIKGQNFLQDALKEAEPAATAKLIKRTQERLDAFHKSKGDPGKVSGR